MSSRDDADAGTMGFRSHEDCIEYDRENMTTQDSKPSAQDGTCTCCVDGKIDACKKHGAPEPSAQDELRSAFDEALKTIGWTYANGKADVEKVFQAGAQWQASRQSTPCNTCSGHGLIGGFEGGAAPGYVSEPCPDCGVKAPADLHALTPNPVDGQKSANIDGNSLHAAIMNLPCDYEKCPVKHWPTAYKYGHRDARHAAAELVANAAPVQTAVAMPDGEALKAWLSDLETEVGLSCNSGAMQLFTKVRTYLQQDGRLASVQQPAAVATHSDLEPKP